MIPLLSPSELEANPSFARLWESITAELLENDGSSRRENQERGRRWRAKRRRRGGEVDGGGSYGTHGSGEGSSSFTHRDAVGGGGMRGYDDQDQNQEDDEDDDDIDDGGGGGCRCGIGSGCREEIGEKGGKKERQLSLSLEEQIHAFRVDRVKRRILRDLLDDLAYLDLSDGQSGGGRGRGDAGARESRHRSHSAEARSRSRIPIPAPVPVVIAGAGAGAGAGAVSRTAEMEFLDVANKDSDPQGQVVAANGRQIPDGRDDSIERSSGRFYLPPSLRELVRVIAAYLHVGLDGLGSPLSNEVQERRRGMTNSNQKGEDDEEKEDVQDLLYEDIQRFKANIGPIADAVSSRLIELESSLCALSNIALQHGDGNEDGHDNKGKGTGKGSHVGHRVPQNLHESIQTQLSRLSDLRDTVLPSSLTTLTTTLQHLLTLQRQLLQLQIQHLETSKHGVLSRYTMSKVAFLDTVAQAMALKVQVLELEARKECELSPQAERRKGVIREKVTEVEREEGELDDRIGVLEGVLSEYEAVDPGIVVMGKLGARYTEIEEEMQGVKRDIETLEARLVG